MTTPQKQDLLCDSFARARQTASYWHERLIAQTAFARFLCDRHPDQSAPWQKAIAESERIAAKAALSSSAESLAEAMAEAEGALAPLTGAARDYTVYCVGHAHIDMNWMWSWPETVSVTVDTITTVLRLMEEFPDFVFSQSQASIYRILEEHAPQVLEQVCARVKEGRFEVTASHWVESDKNMVDGESLCRHLLYTREYMHALFGLRPEDVAIDWSPDTFGHAHTVPTYLTRGGVRYVYLHRPGVHTPPQPRPEAFWWQGPDGSQVLVRNDMRRGYNGAINARSLTECLRQFVHDTQLPLAMYVYGVGDHGGGPTRRDLHRLADMQQWPVFPTVRAARAHEFFERLQREGGELITISDELNMEFTGCYTTQSLIKKANRYATRRLLEAETAAAIAGVCVGHVSPAEPLKNAWRDTLFSHFHDILPGSCVHDSRTYSHGLYQQAVATTSQVQTAALRAIAARVNIEAASQRSPADSGPRWDAPRSAGAGVGRGATDGNLSEYSPADGCGPRPVVVFNPLPVERSEIVEATVWDAGWGWEERDQGTIAFGARSPDGTVVRAQVIDKGNDYWGHRFVRLAFPARLPSLGYATYAITEDGPEWADDPGAHQVGRTHQCAYSYYERSPEGLENEHLLLDIDMTTGGIRRLVHKPSGTQVVAPESGSHALEHAYERTRSMDAWIIQHADAWQGAEVTGVRRGLAGPHKATIEVDARVRGSTFTVVYELRQNDPLLYVHIRGRWVEYWTAEHGAPALRFSVPLAAVSLKAVYEVPFGAIERTMEHGEEVPALRWALVTAAPGGVDANSRATRQASPSLHHSTIPFSPSAGLLLLNDSKHGHSVTGNRLNLTLIRSTHEPDPLPEIGSHEMHLALMPFADQIRVRQAILAADRFDHAPSVVSTDTHPGTLPPVASLMQVSENVQMMSLKATEDGQGWVIRLANPSGQAQRAEIGVNQSLCGRLMAAAAVDVLERAETERAELEAGEEGTINLEIPADAIQAVRIDFSAP
jgi:alpha-mannosidase